VSIAQCTENHALHSMCITSAVQAVKAKDVSKLEEKFQRFDKTFKCFPLPLQEAIESVGLEAASE
jgi:hypothetical protein